MVSGVTPCLVKIASLEDTHADVEIDATVNQSRYLRSGTTGSAHLLFRPQVLGEQWSVVRLSNPGGNELIRFQLSQTLTLRVPESSTPEHASAWLMEWSNDIDNWIESETQIEVYDLSSDSEGMWNGLDGYRGWAKKIPEDYVDGDGLRWPAYEIIWMERIAQKIRFTSTEYMSKTNPYQMSASVDWYNHQGKNPGGTVIIHDPQHIFPDAYDGAKGVAYYNNYHERYEIEECHRLADRASGVLSGDGCSGSLTVSTFSVQEHGEFIGEPEEAPSITNPYKHVGSSGAAVQLLRVSNSMPNGDWVVIDMEKGALTVVAKDGVTWSSPTLQQQRIEIYAEFCDETPTPETIDTAEEECPS